MVSSPKYKRKVDCNPSDIGISQGASWGREGGREERELVSSLEINSQLFFTTNKSV